MKTFGLYKKEKLCSLRAIELLFKPDGAEFSRLCFPLRAVARTNSERSSDASIAFLITVPKKRLRHAVDRVLMRRRIRETYRLNHHNCILPEGLRIDIGFVYVASNIVAYQVIDKAMKKILAAVSEHYCGGDLLQNTQELPE